MAESERIIELRAIRQEMADLVSGPEGDNPAIVQLANTIRTLAYHIEQLERRGHDD